MQTRRAPSRHWLLAAIVVLGALVLTACSPEQQDALDRINATRAEHGLPALAPHPGAMKKAQDWAEVMASDGQLRHSNLADGMKDGWQLLGENVGYGGSIAIVHQAFLNSPGHRANILDSRFNWAGTGVAVDANGRVWVTQVFARY